MSGVGDTWYKREPRRFIDGVQGLGPELIGAYSVILDLIYARDGDLPRDDRHLSGVLGCSKRKAAALTDALIELGKLSISGGKIGNPKASDVLEIRRKQRETSAKGGRTAAENKTALNENKDLASTNRIEENRDTPLPPLGGFEDFWNSCPFKNSKPTAERAWRSLSAEDREAATLAVVGWFSDWKARHPMCQINPATYLRNKRWQDEGFSSPVVSLAAVRTRQAEAIKSGKEYLTRSISESAARQLLADGLVTETECKKAGFF